MAYSSVNGAGAMMPLKALGAFVYGVEALVVGSMAMLAGAGIQLALSIVLGLLFALHSGRGSGTGSGYPLPYLVGGAAELFGAVLAFSFISGDALKAKR